MATVTMINNRAAIPPVAVLRFEDGTKGDKTITAASYTVLLDGSASYDADGPILSYQWEEQINSGAWNIFNSSTENKAFRIIRNEASYKYRVRVRDNSNLSAVSNVLTVNLDHPVTNTIVARINNDSNNAVVNSNGFAFELDGTGSTTSNTNIVTYQWTVISATTNNYKIQNASGSVSNLLFTGECTIDVRLKVIDNLGYSDTVDVQVINS